MAAPVYPATNNAEAIELNISNANQFFTILRGGVDDFIMTYEGNGEIPSVAKALNEAAAYKTPLPWETTGEETDLLQPRVFEGGAYAPLQVPAPFSATPDSNNWRLLQNDVVKSTIDATSDPTVNSDASQGYSVNSLWINQSTSEVFRCLDATVGAAVWVKTTLTIDELGALAIGNDASNVPYDNTDGVYSTDNVQSVLDENGTLALGDDAADVPYDNTVSGLSAENVQSAIDEVVVAVEALDVDSLVPPGVIWMWSGSIPDIPSGWALCDGSNGTPDLRNRFVVGAGGSYSVGDTGGADSVALTVQQLPEHNHTASTGSAGGHSHTGSASSAGAHTHYTARNVGGLGSGGGSNRLLPTNYSVGSAYNTGSAGAHTHSLSINAGGAHTHTVSVGNTGGGQAHENRPPYYALAYIMKL